MPEVREQVEAEKAFEDAVAAANNLAAARAQLGEAVMARVRSRGALMHSVGVLLDTSSEPLSSRFPDPEAYYQFLAQMRDPANDPLDAHSVTDRTAADLALLHTPGEVAYLKTYSRRNPEWKERLAIGRIVATPVLKEMNGLRGRELVLVTQTGVAPGNTPYHSWVGVDDIARQHNDSNPMLHRLTEVVLGAGAVRPIVERAYAGISARHENQLGIFEALARSGLQLGELGVDAQTIANLLQETERDMEACIRNEAYYDRQGLMLPALVGGAAAALRTIERALEGMPPHEVSREFGQDYHTLQSYREHAD